MKHPDLSFRSLSVEQMPGFEDGGFRLDDLEAGINIITGRNASGKTTAARALCLLLWPAESYTWATDRAKLLADIDLDGQEWTIEMRRGRIRYLQDGVSRDHFPGPAEQTRDRYNLALHQLIQSDDEVFAERIRRESAGGYDLQSAAERLGYSLGVRTRSVREYQKFQESRQALKEVRREQKSLKDDERRLEDLKRKREAAREAGRRSEVIELALEVKEAETQYGICREALDRFPEGVKEATGREYDEVLELNESIEEARKRQAKARAEKEAAEEVIDGLSIPEGGISGARLDGLEEHRDTIEKLEGDVDRRKEKLEGLRQEARELIKELHPKLSLEEWEGVDLEMANQLDQFARRAEKIRTEEREVRAIEKWLGKPREDIDLEKLRHGATFLRAWLRETGPEAPEGIAVWISVAAVLAAVLAGVLAAALGMTGWLFLIVPAALLIYGWYARSTAPEGSNADIRRQDYLREDLKEPEAWTVEAVESRLEDLNERIAEAEVEKERRHRWQRLEEQREVLASEREEFNRDREQLQEKIGAVPFVDSDVTLVHFLEKLRSFQRKRAEISGTERRIDHLTSEIDSCVETIDEELHVIGHEEAGTPEKAKQVVKKVIREHREWKDAARDLEEAQKAIERARKSIDQESAKRDEIYERLEVSTGDLDELESVVEQVESYKEKDKEAHAARQTLENARTTLEAHEAYEADIETRSGAALERELESFRTEAEKYNEVHKEIIQIEKLVEQHRNKHDLERALARRDDRLDDLEDLRSRNLRALVGQTLVEAIEQKTRYQSRPAVFRIADQLFSRITSGRYELVLDGSGDPSFQARDTEADRTLTLDELSSGTKIQLLLAVRMAFVESQEQTVKFPLFVDEVLANSDDVRARAIIEAFAEICEDGRQIFYFTAQSDEVNKWRQVLDERNVQYDVRSLTEAASIPAVQVPSSNGLSVELSGNVESPDGRDHAAYGEAIGVPPFRPLVDSIEQIHLWYLIEDVDVLYRCLSRGIEAWGPLETYLDSDGQIHGADTELLQMIRDKAAVLAQVLELYRRGRSKPVSPHVLEETDAVTDTFIEDVKDLLQEVEGDPEELVRGLEEGRVSGFRTAKREELAAYLEERGYIDPDDVIPQKKLRTRIQAITSQYDTVDAGDIERVLNRF